MAGRRATRWQADRLWAEAKEIWALRQVEHLSTAGPANDEGEPALALDNQAAMPGLDDQSDRLAKEDADQAERLRYEHKRELDRQRRAADDLQRSISSSSRSIIQVSPMVLARNVVEEPDYDFFISYASEDQDEVVMPLAEALRARGYTVWYDELTFSVENRLRRSIEKGIAPSRFGVVVFVGDILSEGMDTAGARRADAAGDRR